MIEKTSKIAEKKTSKMTEKTVKTDRKNVLAEKKLSERYFLNKLVIEILILFGTYRFKTKFKILTETTSVSEIQMAEIRTFRHTKGILANQIPFHSE